MTRVIVSISVPLDGPEWQRIEAWRVDPQANVSANICAALAENGELVSKLERLERRHQWLGELLSRGRIVDGKERHGYLTIEEWGDFFGS